MLKNQGIPHWCCTLLAHLPADEFDDRTLIVVTRYLYHITEPAPDGEWG